MGCRCCRTCSLFGLGYLMFSLLCVQTGSLRFSRSSSFSSLSFSLTISRNLCVVICGGSNLACSLCFLLTISCYSSFQDDQNLLFSLIIGFSSFFDLDSGLLIDRSSIDLYCFLINFCAVFTFFFLSLLALVGFKGPMESGCFFSMPMFFMQICSNLDDCLLLSPFSLEPRRLCLNYSFNFEVEVAFLSLDSSLSCVLISNLGLVSIFLFIADIGLLLLLIIPPRLSRYSSSFSTTGQQSQLHSTFRPSSLPFFCYLLECMRSYYCQYLLLTLHIFSCMGQVSIKLLLSQLGIIFYSASISLTLFSSWSAGSCRWSRKIWRVVGIGCYGFFRISRLSDEAHGCFDLSSLFLNYCRQRIITSMDQAKHNYYKCQLLELGKEGI